MHRAVLRLALKELTAWLLERFPPSGKPFVYDFEAEALQLINLLPAGEGPEVLNVDELNAKSLTDVYEWVFKSVIEANTGQRGWGLACHSLRAYALEHVDELLKRVQAPTSQSPAQGRLR